MSDNRTFAKELRQIALKNKLPESSKPSIEDKIKKLMEQIVEKVKKETKKAAEQGKTKTTVTIGGFSRVIERSNYFFKVHVERSWWHKRLLKVEYAPNDLGIILINAIIALGFTVSSNYTLVEHGFDDSIFDDPYNGPALFLSW